MLYFLASYQVRLIEVAAQRASLLQQELIELC